MKQIDKLNKGNRVYLTTSRPREELADALMAGVTQITRPTMMDNKADGAGVLYGGLEENHLWLMQGAKKKSGFAPQRQFAGFLSRQGEQNLVVGSFGFARGFHLTWLLCTVIGGVFMLMMLQSVVVAVLTAAVCLICWIVAAVGGCTKYKEEERAVRAYLEQACAAETGGEVSPAEE